MFHLSRAMRALGVGLVGGLLVASCGGGGAVDEDCLADLFPVSYVADLRQAELWDSFVDEANAVVALVEARALADGIPVDEAVTDIGVELMSDGDDRMADDLVTIYVCSDLANQDDE